MPKGAIESYKTDPRVVLPKEELEAAVRALGLFEGLRLIRAAYGASVNESRAIRLCIVGDVSAENLGGK